MLGALESPSWRAQRARLLVRGPLRTPFSMPYLLQVHLLPHEDKDSDDWMLYQGAPMPGPLLPAHAALGCT